MALLIQLQEQRGQLVTQAREALDAITANTDEARSAELEQRHDAIMAQVDAIDARITREQRVAELEATEQERRERQRPNGEDGESRSRENGGDRTAEQTQAEYRSAFIGFMRAGCDIGALEPEQRELLRRGFVENRTQLAGTPAAGGYTVPVELAREIVRAMKDWGPMYDPAVIREITTASGNEFDIPTNDDTANSAAAKAEDADIVDDGSGDAVFGQKRLDAYVDATPFIKITMELMQDSVFNLEALLAEMLGERLGRRANVRLTTGSGAGQPNGIVTASTLGKTAAAVAAIVADELFDLQHSVNQAYRRSPKCAWMFADSTLLALRKLKDGDGNYLWQMGDVSKSQPAMLLEKPYHINDDVPTIATGNRAIIFGDLSRYWVRKVGSPMIGTVRERFWPKIGLAGLIRYDGELMDAAAVKHLKLA